LSQGFEPLADWCTTTVQSYSLRAIAPSPIKTYTTATRDRPSKVKPGEWRSRLRRELLN